MPLLERVTTLIRANLNDLIDRAEDPEKMLKQVILDMQNQLMQLKTQVAIAIADQHVLLKKQQENLQKASEWERKAELAVEKKQDDLARAALQRALGCRDMATGYEEQVADQKAQVENLKSALQKLQQKLEEAQSKVDLLLTQHRRSRVIARASDARMAMNGDDKAAAFHRMENKVIHAEALGNAKAELADDSVEDKLAALEKHDKIEQLLAQMKERKGLPA